MSQDAGKVNQIMDNGLC